MKTFILCIGAQKSGTTWLYNYLLKNSNVNFGFLKEYHIFDALFIPECKRFLVERKSRALNILGTQALLPHYDGHVFKLLDFYFNPKSYFEYFSSIIDSNKSVTHTGDFTPSYSGLPQEAYAFIKTKLENHGFDVKVIFLMRDPVERCISAAFMELKKAGIQINSDVIERYLDQHFGSPEYQLRTRYDLTLDRAEAVFSKDNIFTCFYEELFSDILIRHLTEFLNLEFIKPNVHQHINASEDKFEIDAALKRKIFTNYRVVYDRMAQRYGKERVQMAWPNSIDLL